MSTCAPLVRIAAFLLYALGAASAAAADMNHRLAREKAQKRGLAEPRDFRGAAHAAFAKRN